MPTYALLGATGSTGSAILRCLLSEPPKDLKANILVRSKAKLLRIFPDLESTTALKINILQGDATDTAVLGSCLQDVDVVFMCVGQNDSKRGISLCHDTAATVITTLGNLRELGKSEHWTPTIIQLRSASLNPTLAKQVPLFARKIVSFCLHYNYEDMKSACQLFQSEAEKNTLKYIFVDPPTMHDADGITRTGHKLIQTEKQEVAISYADLGAAICEIAERKAEFYNQSIGVTATGKVKENWGILMGYLAGGAKGRMFSVMVK